jgi:hypothetical protein
MESTTTSNSKRHQRFKDETLFVFESLYNAKTNEFGGENIAVYLR